MLPARREDLQPASEFNDENLFVIGSVFPKVGKIDVDRRGSVRLEEAAERLGEMLRGDNLKTAMWANGVITVTTPPEPWQKHDLPRRGHS